jgi:N-glycosylase/DNA lyase
VNMKYREIQNEVEITGAGDFDLVRIFECGQCFRWNVDIDGIYTGVALGQVVRIRQVGDRIYISGTGHDFETVWRDYFDLDRDYAAIRKSLCIDSYMTAATTYGTGIRILRQDRWEVLCSFILSQCNNIPRIKGIVERFCTCFGEPIEFNGKTYYTFPTAARTAVLTAGDLAPLRCGYRAPYVIDAARAVTDGRVNLDALAGSGDYDRARYVLKTISGVGDKVANCVILFGLQMFNAFPVDIWMKKAIDRHYGKHFNPAVFGDYAGLAQQYMFYYTRNGQDIAEKWDIDR